MQAKAWAKINLMLRVGPPYPADHPMPGYHPICSWMHAIDLADDLEIIKLPEGASSQYIRRWTNGQPVVWTTEQDLAVRAHRQLEAIVHRPLPIRLTLEKRIPAGAGLGGGSSNAAQTLEMVNRCYGQIATREQLFEAGLRCGTDVRFFQLDEQDSAIDSVDGLPPPRPALVSGVAGDRITRVTRPDRHHPAADIILLLPPFGCDTRLVYKAFDANPTTTLDSSSVMASVDRHDLFGPLGNDLLEAAFSVQPRLRELLMAARSAVDRCGLSARAHMSGSGSTLWFAVPAGHGPHAADQLRAIIDGRADVLVTQLI